MTLAAGSRLGPYEIVAPLGAGGMGEVYRARDTRLGREVAIKVLPAEVAADPDRLRRFEQEARAASALSHPNILTVHDVGNEGGVSFLVTELLIGESLREMLSRGPLPERRVVDIAGQVARGLAVAHQKGIVHRDLKPENLFLTRDGVAKILDFGLARQDFSASGISAEAPTLVDGTVAGTMLGTIGYMAPEQVRGERADARSDLFSFGCLLYEMLAGASPFSRASAIESLHAILREEAAPLESKMRSVPPALVSIVRRCLEKAPEARFQSASDLGFALEQALGSVSLPAPVPARTAGRRQSLAVGLGGAVAILLLALATLNLGGIRSRLLGSGAAATTIDSLAVLPLANFSGDPGQEFFADGMTEALIAELARVRALKVISRTSVMQYKGVKRPLPEIARELGVRGVVEGSVVRAGDQVRITVQLVDARDDRHLWAESYTRDARDVLKLQAEVARSIAEQVGIALSPAEQRAFASAPQVDPEAHRLVLQATDLIRHGSSQLDVQQRISALIDQAIAVAPDFALAHALRGAQRYALAATGYEAGVTSCPAARSELERALALEPDLLAARSLDATLRVSCDFDWLGALAARRGLVDSAPGDGDAHKALGVLLSWLGRHDEAIAEVRRAYELDPLNDSIGGDLIFSLAAAGKHQEAVDAARRVLELSPDSVYVKWNLGNTQLALGRYDEALATYLSRKVANPGTNFMVGLLHGRAGRPREARRVLDYLLERRRQRYVPASMIATVYGGLGKLDIAFDWIARAYDERDAFLLDAAVDPRFDALRSDPRFAALIARMNYPQAGS